MHAVLKSLSAATKVFPLSLSTSLRLASNVAVTEAKAATFGPNSLRVGILAEKIGMTAELDTRNVRLPLTVLKVEKCQVLQQKTIETDGYNALQVGVGSRKIPNTTKPMLGHFFDAGADPKREVQEFRVTPDAFLPLGTEISVAHFLPGQFVDVVGYNKGKMTAGVMKRWGFGGLPASHGVSLAHRSPGSIGNRQDPGRVWKNKKMAGRMGNKRKTIHSLMVYKIDTKNNLIYLKGGVPGNKKGYVRVYDAVRKQDQFSATLKKNPPFPTYIPEVHGPVPEVMVAEASGVNPWVLHYGTDFDSIFKKKQAHAEGGAKSKTSKPKAGSKGKK
eukprot:TRINITY_DN7127_c0_g1_i1.p1 TRINITY_DN7127_c0_g1~~TRINITY_DN7127_c0_g1_i1.p1  ORF type:complete len:331 (+),score=85.19 TRINITY_DN7127_c0_g1_i1:43-1035(+)